MSDPGMLLALFLAGLGFFFTGLEGIKSQLKQITSRRFRTTLHRLTGNPVLAGLWGALFGAISQSASAVAFIMAGLISSGLLRLDRALLVVSWANLGTVALVFLSAIDINLLIYLLLGTTSLMIAFRVIKRHVIPIRVLYSIGLLFFGLKLMREGTVPVSGYSWFASGLEILHGSAYLAFLLGAVLRVVIQSSSAIVIIAVQLAATGLLTGSDVRMVMHGTAVGVGLSVMALSANLGGTPRQIAILQAIINAAAGFLLAGLFVLEQSFGWTGLTRMMTGGGEGTGLRLAIGFALQQGLVVMIGTLLNPYAPRFLSRLSPPTAFENASSSQFLSQASFGDPDTALVLARREQHRMMEFLPHMLDPIRPVAERQSRLNLEELHEASQALNIEIDRFLDDLVDQNLDRESSRQLIQVEQRQRLILSLTDAVRDYVRLVPVDSTGGGMGEAATDITESLHVMLSLVIDSLEQDDPVALELVRVMTSDRGETMESFRRKLAETSDALPVRARSDLFHLTVLFERAIWLLGQILGGDAPGRGAPEGNWRATDPMQAPPAPDDSPLDLVTTASPDRGTDPPARR